MTGSTTVIFRGRFGAVRIIDTMQSAEEDQEDFILEDTIRWQSCQVDVHDYIKQYNTPLFSPEKLAQASKRQSFEYDRDSNGRAEYKEEIPSSVHFGRSHLLR